MESEVMRELTFGEQAVGLNFNPGGNEKVNEVKALYAKIIDICADLRKECTPEQGERGRYLSIAITEAQTAQMWAVKGITK
jgi:hypothetical protein